MTRTQIDVEQFRAEARAWITDNLERRPDGADAAARDVRTDEQIAAARALQQRVFEAGFAGITYPAEYGGQGLTAAHERAFREESVNYVMPDFGAVGGVTVGPIGRSLLAHGS